MKLYLFLLLIFMPVALGTELLVDSATISDTENQLESEWLGIIIPVLLLFITLIMFSIDFGAVGVGTISAVAMIVLWLTGLIPITNPVSLISFVLIIGITTFKVTR